MASSRINAPSACFSALAPYLRSGDNIQAPSSNPRDSKPRRCNPIRTADLTDSNPIQTVGLTDSSRRSQRSADLRFTALSPLAPGRGARLGRALMLFLEAMIQSDGFCHPCGVDNGPGRRSRGYRRLNPRLLSINPSDWQRDCPVIGNALAINTMIPSIANPRPWLVSLPRELLGH